jgi:hypothetical protein
MVHIFTSDSLSSLTYVPFWLPLSCIVQKCCIFYLIQHIYTIQDKSSQNGTYMSMKRGYRR